MSKEYDDNSDEQPVTESFYFGEQIESANTSNAYPLELFFDLNNLPPES